MKQINFLIRFDKPGNHTDFRVLFCLKTNCKRFSLDNAGEMEYYGTSGRTLVKYQSKKEYKVRKKYESCIHVSFGDCGNYPFKLHL